MITIIKEILYHRRQFFIDMVQAPLFKTICKLASKYPKPDKERLVWANSKKLVDFFAYIRKYHNNPSRQVLFDAVERIIISKHEVDGYYAFFLDMFVEWAKENDWESEYRGFPMYRYWNGPLNKNYQMESNPKHIPDWLEMRMRAKLAKKEA